MINTVEQKKELLSFDSKLVDINGKELSIDCRVLLPNIWGEQVDITLATPNSDMPIKHFDNPSKLNSICDRSQVRVEMEKVHYRFLTTNIVPSRKTGQTTILIAHIDSLHLIEKFTVDENKLFIYISGSDFFERLSQSHDSLIDELAEFNCPKLGRIKLQRYGVKAGVNNSRQILQSFGYQLEVLFSEDASTTEYILEHITPTLDLISVLLRQRIAVYGWQSLQNNQRARFWKYPLETSETYYVGVEPKKYLVSFETFQSQVNIGIENYQALEQSKKKALYQLSYKLSPAIELRDEERFMSLFKGLEFIASKNFGDKELTFDDQLLIKSLIDVAKSFEKTNPKVFDRIDGLIKKVSQNGLSLKEKLILLLEKENVFCSDLWPIDGNKGLTGIRNKLAHMGSVGVNHQGLAVSTFHLTLMVERLVFSILDLMESEIQRDEWLNRSYFNRLKTDIFKV